MQVKEKKQTRGDTFAEIWLIFMIFLVLIPAPNLDEFWWIDSQTSLDQGKNGHISSDLMIGYVLYGFPQLCQNRAMMLISTVN